MKNLGKKLEYKSDGKINFWALLLLATMLLYYLLPSSQLVIKFYIALIIILAFIGCYTLFTGDQFAIKILFGASAIAILYYLLAHDDLVESIGRFSNYLSVCFPTILLSWALPRCNRKQKWILLIFVTVIYLFVLGNTYEQLEVDEEATRLNETDMEMKSSNAGTYDFAYATGALIPFFGIWFVKTKNKWMKVLSACLVAGTFVLLATFQYTLALLGSIVALLAIPVLKEKRKVYMIFYVLAFVLLIFFMEPLLRNLSEMLSSEQMSTRISELADSMSGSSEEGHFLSGRLGLYGQAIDAFLQHPFAGNQSLEFDAHSTILAIFSRIGIWGGIIYIWMLRKMKKRTEYVLKIGNDTWLFTPVFIYLLFMALTNPVHAAFMTNVMIWLVIPIGVSLLEGERKNAVVEN